MAEDWRIKQKRDLERAAVTRHVGYEPTDPPPLGSLQPPPPTPPQRRGSRQSINLEDDEIAHSTGEAAHRWVQRWGKTAGALSAICVAVTSLNVWIHTRWTAQLDAAVDASVTKVMVNIEARVKTLETNTAGLPEWRGKTTDIDRDQSILISIAQRDATNANTRLDAKLDKVTVRHGQ